MKILGIGVDIVENERFKKLVKNKEFIKRIFNKNEIRFCKNISNKTSFFAKRFAAKESLAKAIGTGFRKNFNFKDIEIMNNNIGKPYYSKTSKINLIIYDKFKTKKYDLFLSISDEKDYSIAFTIIQNR